MSWRERESRHEGRGRSPLWEPRRSPPRRRERERRERDRGERGERGERERGERRRSRSPRRRRSPRRSVSPPAAPSPPRISSVDMELSSDSSDRERRRRDERDRDRDRDREERDRDRERELREDRDLRSELGVAPGDWICKCGSYNFKRRLVCYKRKCQGNRSEGAIYSGDADKDSHWGISKRLLFRRLDALTTEEKILDALKERCSKSVLDSIAGITIGRETLTGASKCLAYINFNSIADSTAAHNELLDLSPRLQIDDREVLVTYYNEPQKPKPSTDYNAYYGPTASYQGAALSEADRVNAAAAVAQSAIASAQARHQSWPLTAPAFAGTTANSKIKVPTGDGKTKYTPPDVRTFMYDETSGYYYDPATGLYYDGTSQYFYNNQLNQYMYWDATASTYVAATQTQQNTDQPKLPTPPDATSDNTIKGPEEKKKKDKEDKVKVAKKIAKDMERWARTLNQKKENARSNTVMEQPTDTGPSKGSADIGFSVLGSGPSLLSAVREREPSPPQPSTDDFLIKKTEPPIDSDDGIIDWVKLTCLLCKRKFPSVDILTKHKTMSDLHKSNLAEYRSRMEEEQPQTNGYRDRAAERRMKFGEDEPIMRKRFDPPEPSMMTIMPTPPAPVIDTIGGKMLQKMGWSEGRGLGKEEQGRIVPIEAEQRVGLAGLGQKRGIYTPTPGETYRDTVKKLMIARYKEVVGQEESNN